MQSKRAERARGVPYASFNFARVCSTVSDHASSGKEEETYNICQLGLCNQILCFGSNKLLLQCYQLRTCRLLVFQFLNLIADLGLAITAWLYAALSISDLLQDTSVILEILCKQVFLLPNLRQEDAELVGDVRDRVVVRRLTPVRKLRGD
jgi:hypothetical protein